MTVDPAGARGGSSEKSLSLLGSMSSTVLSSPAQLEGLELGHLLGKGTFGSVVGDPGGGAQIMYGLG